MSEVRLKCAWCDNRAEWMYLDEVNDQLVPLCDSHMKNVIMEFGEVNIEYYAIDNVKGWLDAVNKRLKFLSERYASILKRVKEG